MCGHDKQNVVRDGLSVQKVFFTGVMSRKTDIFVNFSGKNVRILIYVVSLNQI